MAEPSARPEEVARDMRDTLHLDYMPRYIPEEAVSYMDIDEWVMQDEIQVNAVNFKDLRVDAWERLQRTRMMVVLQEGVVQDTLVIPYHISIEEAQSRVDELFRTWEIHQVTAVNGRNWVVVRTTLPTGLLQIVDEWQDLRDAGFLGMGRGGMLQPIDEGMDVRGPIPPAVWVVSAYDPCPASLYLVKRDARVWQLREHMADSFGIFPHDLWFSTTTRPLHVTDMCRSVPGRVIVVHDSRRMHEESYWTPFRIEWRGSMRDDEATQSQIDWPTMERGAGRRGRTAPSDPKTAMLGWAQDRVAECCPNLPPSTATMLLKAEQRTVTSVLHARSSHQVGEVMAAALRRAGLSPISAQPAQQEHQPQPQPHGEQQQQHQQHMQGGNQREQRQSMEQDTQVSQQSGAQPHQHMHAPQPGHMSITLQGTNELIMHHIGLTNQLFSMMHTMPTADQMLGLVSTFQQNNSLMLQGLAAVGQSVGILERKIDHLISSQQEQDTAEERRGRTQESSQQPMEESQQTMRYQEVDHVEPTEVASSDAQSYQDVEEVQNLGPLQRVTTNESNDEQRTRQGDQEQSEAQGPASMIEGGLREVEPPAANLEHAHVPELIHRLEQRSQQSLRAGRAVRPFRSAR